MAFEGFFGENPHPVFLRTPLGRLFLLNPRSERCPYSRLPRPHFGGWAFFPLFLCTLQQLRPSKEVERHLPPLPVEQIWVISSLFGRCSSSAKSFSFQHEKPPNPRAIHRIHPQGIHPYCHSCPPASLTLLRLIL